MSLRCRLISLAGWLFLPFVLSSAEGLKGQDSQTLFLWSASPREGGRTSMELLRLQDPISDQRSCRLSVRYIPDQEASPIFFSIQGPDDFTILAIREGLAFVEGEPHRARVGASQPIPLVTRTSTALRPADRDQARVFLRRLVAGEEARIRYYTSRGQQEDRVFQFPFLGHVYGKAVQPCGWQDLGVTGRLPPPRLEVRPPGPPGAASGSLIWVQGNTRLRLIQEPPGLGCQLGTARAGERNPNESRRLFGRSRSVWQHGATQTSRRLVIRDGSGQVVFSSDLPVGQTPAPWAPAPEAAGAMWAAAPYGHIALWVANAQPEIISLYGFRELWAWGMEHCGFPALHP